MRGGGASPRLPPTTGAGERRAASAVGGEACASGRPPRRGGEVPAVPRESRAPAAAGAGGPSLAVSIYGGPLNARDVTAHIRTEERGPAVTWAPACGTGSLAPAPSPLPSPRAPRGRPQPRSAPAAPAAPRRRPAAPPRGYSGGGALVLKRRGSGPAPAALFRARSGKFTKARKSRGGPGAAPPDLAQSLSSQ